MPNATLSKQRMRVRGRTPDVRSMLEQLGVATPLIEMAIQHAFQLPRTTDPYSAGMIILVKAIQRGLNALGFNLLVDGGLGDQTVAALSQVSGPRWYDKSWLQLMGDVLSAPAAVMPAPRLDRIADALGQSDVGSTLKNAIPWVVGAFAIYWFGFRKKKSRR